MTIFISIAAYRDPQLVPTVEDCLGKARYPEALRFGICWQHGDDEGPLPFAADGRFRVLDVPWHESRGACWARSAIMGLYAGEDYFLQLDSHHRFVPDWDVKLLDQFQRTGSSRPILTAYATPFHPDDPHPFDVEPMQMNFDRFTAESIILFRPSAIEGWQTRTDPVRARFLSAHFLFAPGSFVRDVPYDPALYFIGEEITLAVRAFTCGYDLFHPGEIILWHEYTRDYRPHKHWTDHQHENRIEIAWHERDRASMDRVRQLLLEPWVGEYGLGAARTLEEYETFAGVSFRHRKAQDFTRRGLEPPNPAAPPDWQARSRRYAIEVNIDRETVPRRADDYTFWYVGFHDESGVEIFRGDAGQEELAGLLDTAGQRIPIRRAFESEFEPASWTVWPHSRSEGWLTKIEGPWAARDAPTTIVTALLDLGRDALAPAFARCFDTHYLEPFITLLAIDTPMIVHVHPEHEALVWQHRDRCNTRVVPLTADDLEATASFDRIQQIRQDGAWRTQADWLAESPQASLPHYNALAFSKMRWLADAARDNPFGTPTIFWMDAALTNTVSATLLHDPRLPRGLGEIGATFAWISFPYEGPGEIHGFPRAALERYAGTPVSRVVRGSLFGGSARIIPAVAALHEQWLERTLGDGCMGTEESLFTLIAHRYPELHREYGIGPDGMMAAFIRQVVDGTAAPLAETVGGAGGDGGATDARTGYVVIDGLKLLQNRHAAAAFDRLWHHLSTAGDGFARVIELGTGPGGLAVLLKRHCEAVGARFVTYDRLSAAVPLDRFTELNIDFRVKDFSESFTVGEIARELQQPGVSVLLCDGADPARELSLFADYLKPGDLVLAHDYASSAEVYRRDIAGKLWSWCEVTDADLVEASERNGLEEILTETFHPAVWTCRVKRGHRVTSAPPMQCANGTLALYLQSFNAPDQFARWIAATEAAEPLLLRRSRKVLLNNSTDRTTRGAYDDLAERYGFIQVRQGNLGISGGRMWCARHFDEQTDDDMMVFFEDDMLLQIAPGVCRNGLPTRVPGFVERAIEILQHEPSLDLLKLSFTEFFGDHRQNWAWYNVSPGDRIALFPHGNETRIDAIRSHAGLAYAVGEFHYSNWPLLITRRGNRTLFLGETFPLDESHLMVRALTLARARHLLSGVLLASPINHDRQTHYAAAERKEA